MTARAGVRAAAVARAGARLRRGAGCGTGRAGGASALSSPPRASPRVRLAVMRLAGLRGRSLAVGLAGGLGGEVALGAAQQPEHGRGVGGGQVEGLAPRPARRGSRPAWSRRRRSGRWSRRASRRERSRPPRRWHRQPGRPGPARADSGSTRGDQRERGHRHRRRCGAFLVRWGGVAGVQKPQPAGDLGFDVVQRAPPGPG